MVEDLRAESRVIHDADKGRPELHVGNVFRHVPADASVGPDHPADIAPARNILFQRIALDIHKYRTDNQNSHSIFPASCHLICFGDGGAFLFFCPVK